MENPPNINDTPIPEEAREDFSKWNSTGDDSALTALIGHLFASLEISNFDSVYAKKGDSAVIIEDFGIDSLTLAELLFYTEDLVGIRITNEEAAKLTTIGDLKTYLQAKRLATAEK